MYECMKDISHYLSRKSDSDGTVIFGVIDCEC